MTRKAVEEALGRMVEAERNYFRTWNGSERYVQDAMFVEAVMLDDRTFAFRHNTPNLDTDWEVGRDDDLMDFWEDQREQALEGAKEKNLVEEED